MAKRFSVPTAPRCPVCDKSVYKAEEVKGPRGQSWHAMCFCCRCCGRSMRGGEWRDAAGEPHCQACHARHFGPKGIGFGNTLGDTGVENPQRGAIESSSLPTPPTAPAATEPTAAPQAQSPAVEQRTTLTEQSPETTSQATTGAVVPAATESEGIGDQPRKSLKERMAEFQAALGPKPSQATGAADAAAVAPKGGGARFSVPQAPQCGACGKSVYSAEQVKGPRGRSWHAMCFCCKECSKSMRGGEWREHDGEPYCHSCQGKLFGPKGIGYGNTLGDTGYVDPKEPVVPSTTATQPDEPVRSAATSAKQVADVAGDGPQATAQPLEVESSSPGENGLTKVEEVTQNLPSDLQVSAAAATAPTGGYKARGSRFGSSAPKCGACGKSVYTAEEVKGPRGGSWHAMCFCCKTCGKSLRGGEWREHDGKPYCHGCQSKLFGPKGIGFGNTLGDTGYLDAKPVQAAPTCPAQACESAASAVAPESATRVCEVTSPAVGPSLAAVAPAEVLGTEPKVELEGAPELPAKNAPSQQGIVGASVDGGPCASYRVDLTGASFGDCKCGHPKSAHSF
eukprot:TRINITY_DN44884_c0_g1_i1.p1 TRINITY_DN44884_c0_g1~~TRINITY_DN44884_c0_g1_i1.p1  ORF type:complete len:592 (+),score=85.93 TRINITY_DN44884_c0_g1_i1:80-1777(+)